MRRRRVLSAEEKRLWSEIAATARPLPGRTVPVEPVPATAAGQPPADAAPSAAKPGPSVFTPLPPLAPPAAVRLADRLLLHPIERPVRRRLGRGRIAIDARIDLHGLTEAVAHTALLGFLRRERDGGARHVLVITGRGASFGSSGTLKRSLPFWLATADFRALVAGFEPAERNHGGEGAFYMRLRRR